MNKKINCKYCGKEQEIELEELQVVASSHFLELKNDLNNVISEKERIIKHLENEEVYGEELHYTKSDLVWLKEKVEKLKKIKEELGNSAHKHLNYNLEKKGGDKNAQR